MFASNASLAETALDWKLVDLTTRLHGIVRENCGDVQFKLGSNIALPDHYYITSELTTEDWNKSLDYITDTFLLPMGYAMGRNFKRRGGLIVTCAPGGEYTGQSIHLRGMGLGIRGQVAYNPTTQRHTLTFDTFTNRV